jgi:ribonuclease HI
MLGIKKALYFGAKHIKVYGDSEIIVKQVCEKDIVTPNTLRPTSWRYAIRFLSFKLLILNRDLEARMRELTY